MESRHNLKYWRGEDYLGIGPAAHSMLGGRRFFFRRDLRSFLAAPLSALEDDGPGGGYEEYIMLRLRLSEGIDLAEASRLFGGEAEELRQRAEAFIRSGHARLEGGRLSLTPEGFLISNTVISALLA
jgi:oxygen-independent coproporphyrinogen-3 oxidase